MVCGVVCVMCLMCAIVVCGKGRVMCLMCVCGVVCGCLKSVFVWFVV